MLNSASITPVAEACTAPMSSHIDPVVSTTKAKSVWKVSPPFESEKVSSPSKRTFSMLEKVSVPSSASPRTWREVQVPSALTRMS